MVCSESKDFTFAKWLLTLSTAGSGGNCPEKPRRHSPDCMTPTERGRNFHFRVDRAIELHQKYWPVYPEKDRPTAHLLIGLYQSGEVIPINAVTAKPLIWFSLACRHPIKPRI